MFVSFPSKIATFRDPKFKYEKPPEFVRARRIDKYIIELEDFVRDLIRLNNYNTDPKIDVEKFIVAFQSLEKKHSKVITAQREYVNQFTIQTLTNEGIDNSSLLSLNATIYFYQEQLYRYDYYHKLSSVGITLSSK